MLMVDETDRQQSQTGDVLARAGEQVHHIELPGMEVALADSEEVWLPHDPTIKFIEVLSDDQIVAESIQGRRVLDVGTGSGIIGIQALKRGAEYVTMTDINQSVIELVLRNLELNGLRDGDSQFAVADIDGFMGIQEPFDTIISNPPVQPAHPTAHLDNPAAKHNETLNGGRYLLDTLIKYSRSYLTPNGKLYLLCSSRHGHALTREMLDSHYGEENWDTLLELEYPIDPEYHGPYMDFWLQMQTQDGDIRVYARDAEGQEVHPDRYDPNDTSLQWFSRSYVIEARNMNGHQE